MPFLRIDPVDDARADREGIRKENNVVIKNMCNTAIDNENFTQPFSRIVVCTVKRKVSSETEILFDICFR